MSFSYQPTSGVLSGTSFESQSEAFLARAAVGSMPGSSYQSLSSSGASSPASGLSLKSFVAPSAGWYSIVCKGGAKMINNTNGMTINSVVDAEGEGCCFLPVSAGQNVSVYWTTGRTPDMRFIAAVEA